jgi:hypothetical protein
MNGGDELALSFNAGSLPPKPVGYSRSLFLHVVGWDKDADFHVTHGSQVGPLPFSGMDSQAYGSQAHPPASDSLWIEKFNTRWVGPLILEAARR